MSLDDFYTITLPHHHLSLDLHEHPLYSLSIIPLDRSLLSNLYSLGSLACYDESVSWLEHDEGGADRILARWDDPESLPLPTTDTLSDITYDTE